MTDAGARIDASALESYLSAELDAAVTDAEVVHDGLNLTLAVSTAEAERAYAVRRPNKFRHRDSFLDLHREYGVLERLQETPILAPEPVLYCDDESIGGDPFLVTTYLDGECVPLGSNLPDRFRTPAARRRLATWTVDTLAEIHTVGVEPFTDVCDRVPVRKQVARIVDQLDEATEVTGHELPDLWAVADWLRANVPPDSETTLVHGDYRPGNVLFTGADRPEITGVLDWETAFLGDPLTELGYLLLRWRDDGDPTPSLDEIEARCSDDVREDLRDTNQRGLAPFTNEPGSPSRRDLVARYEERTGIKFEHERFYRALAAFVLATVWEDLHRHRVEAGAESDREPYVEYLSLLAERIVDGEFEL